jgi:hypothetical protein
MEDALIGQMKAVFWDTGKCPIDLETLSNAVLRLAEIFSVDVRLHMDEPNATRPYRVLRAQRRMPKWFTEHHAVSLENSGYRDASYLSAPDDTVTVKYYSSTGDLAINIVANWELRRDIQAKLKLMNASRTQRSS